MTRDEQLKKVEEMLKNGPVKLIVHPDLVDTVRGLVWNIGNLTVVGSKFLHDENTMLFVQEERTGLGTNKNEGDHDGGAGDRVRPS